MTAQPKKWQRAGFASDVEYRSACAAKRSTERASMASTKTKGCAALVLAHMWRRADFHRPVVVVTKKQLMMDTGADLKTIKRALVKLREEGSVKPMKNWQGGAGVATTWALRIAGKQETPSEQQQREQIEQRERDATWRYLKGKFGPARALEILDEGDE